ncbi:MAG: choice-of-anchor D domain-containing protein, partial [Candidatus Poribacteria bacterium]
MFENINNRLKLAAILTLFIISSFAINSFGDVANPFETVTIVIVSGDNQSGKIKTILPEPLTVKALNANGKGAAFADLRFTVISGGGGVSKTTSNFNMEVAVNADSSGIASVRLKLGSTKEINRVRVTSDDAPAVIFTATVMNSKPKLDPIGNKNVNEGETLKFKVTAFDADQDDILSFSTGTLPRNASFDLVTNTFTFAPDYNQAGTYSVTFFVSDGTDTDSQSVSITVKNVNRPPVIRVLPLLPDNQIGLDFETLEVGDTSDRIFQIHNDGNAPLEIFSITMTDPQFQPMTYIKTSSSIIDLIDPNIIKLLDEPSILAILGPGAKFSDVKRSPSDPLVTINYPNLNPGECLLIRSQFKPLSIGQKTARFVIKNDDLDESVVNVNLKGVGTLTPDIRVSSNSINFGDVQIGTNSEKLLTIFNDGKGVLNINSITTDDPQFTVLQYSNVSPNSIIVVTIRWTPTLIGVKTAILRINSNDPDESLVLVNLQGNGFRIPTPDINLSTTSINFGNVQVGQSLTKEFQIQNLGDALLQITSINSSNSQFVVTGMANLVPPSDGRTDVPVGSSITISVKFTPLLAGSKVGVIAILSNDPDESNVTLIVQGEGIIVPTPNIRVSPNSLEFGDVEIGKSARRTFNIYNDGTAVLRINSITVNNSKFTIITGSDDSSNVQPGGIAIIPVDFKPLSLGQIDAVISISSNDPDEPTKTITARGKGINQPAPDIRLSTTVLNFGDVQAGTSKILDINIYNDGNLPLVLNNMTTNSDQFAVIWDSQSVPAGGYSTISVRFSPMSSGIKTATLVITSNDPDEQSVTVLLQGKGFEIPIPDIEIYPFTIDFASVEIGKSLMKNFRIYNRGNVALQITSITSSNSQFTTINTASISAGTSMMIQVNFTPVSIGSKRATLTVNSNDPDEPTSLVSLYGDGAYPGYINIGAWTNIQPTNMLNNLNDVFFVDENRGWVVGYNGTVISTINGGTSWTAQQSGTARSLNGVFFTDPLTGWAVGQYGTIMKTTNGGLSWTQLNLSISNTLMAVEFANPGKGWAVGEYGNILTINESFWTYQNSHVTLDLNDLDFVSNYQGWVVGNYGTILKTLDGGQTWTPQQSKTTEALTGIDFMNSNEGWAVGANGTILHTIDSGQNWFSQNSNLSGQNNTNFEMLNDVDFVNSSNGWVVGNNGVILLTIDGGTTWVRVDSGTIQSLRAVYFLNQEIGWTVGTNGTILKFMPDYPTNISSVTVTGSPSRSGGIIRITAIGQARNEARFSIAGVVSNVVMQENTPGTYVGTYTVVDGTNAVHAVVTVTFANKYGNIAVDTSQTVTIDSTATITSATVSPNTAKTGDTINIIAFGEMGSSVKWTIENVISDAVMTELPYTNGKYVGEYKV